VASGTGRAGSANKRSTRRGRRAYRKRNALPAIALFTLLCLAAAAVWFKVAAEEATIADAIHCRPEATPPAGTSFSPQGRSALNDTVPLPPSEITVRVRNATDTFGLANRTSNTLEELGIGKLKKPTNDPAYEEREPQCYGQIRFGPQSKAAARTISLIDPCLELVATSRETAVINLVLGADFSGIHISDATRTILETLREWNNSERVEATAGPSIEPKLLSKARDAYC